MVRSRVVHSGLERRSYSGVARLGADLSDEVKATFDYQRKMQIPRTMMGKSIMEFGKLARYACNGGLDLVEVDMISAFLQLRLADAGDNVAMPACRKLLSCEDIDGALERMSGGALAAAKKTLKGMMYLADGKTVPIDELPPVCADFLLTVRDEMGMYVDWSLQRYPGLIEDFKDRPHPRLSAHAVIDEHNETQAMKPVIGAFQSLGKSDSFFVSPCHDGLDFPSQGISHSDLLAVAKQSSPFRFAIKSYKNFATFARGKWPLEDWGHVSKVSGTDYLDCMDVVRHCGTFGDSYRQALPGIQDFGGRSALHRSRQG